ncbi:HAD family hydrolase [Streptomyces sp. NRRL S-350]|uniref:HAD family hydrolase n=1 Tax=Streptomyces sp. NRRL S-350 TaxID=1463902 RepID=UPI0007C50956|nr:HAD family hydrolase [Streptomyces sp. NRRL S-350]
MSLPSAVVFDLDGVLLDTTENMRRAFAATWQAAGRTGEPPFPTFLSHMGAPLHRILGELGLPTELTTVYEAESTRHIGLIAPHEGVHTVLDALAAAGVPTAVATGKRHERAVQALTAAGMAHRLDAVIGSDQVARPKPDPEIVLTALAALPGAVDPARAFFVGDSVLDVRAGRAAGTPVVAAGWGQTSPQTLHAEGPDHYAGTAVDLLAVFGLPAAGHAVPKGARNA